MTLFGTDLPIIQAPMAGAQLSELAIAVSDAGGLGSLPCAMLSPADVRAELAKIGTRRVNLNFFCHAPPRVDEVRERAWRDRLAPYYRALGIDPEAPVPSATRAPFDDAMFDVIAEYRPAVASFHFGLPAAEVVARVKQLGVKVISSATTVEEARWLAARGCDAIIAQGWEAGGHRGMFLATDLATQLGTFALVPRIVDAVDVPVIAAGGIADARGVAAAFALGASAVLVGTAYLACPESRISDAHRAALASGDETVVTNVYTGRPARGIATRFVREVGPIAGAPEFPRAATAVGPLRAKDPTIGPFWSGQHRIARTLSAAELTRALGA